MAKIGAEYYVTVKGGKQHPTWPGVLVALHENGLLGIEVSVLQYPAPENQHTAVCQAIVTMRGEDGRELIFQEVGDASPANVGNMIIPHILRMAATRAKGRAGRDALALGVALAEELGPDADERPSTTSHNARTAPAATNGSSQRARHDPQEEWPLCAWPDCPERVSPQQERLSREKFEKCLCADHEGRLAAVRATKAAKAAA